MLMGLLVSGCTVQWPELKRIRNIRALNMRYSIRRIGGNLKYTAGKYHSIYGDVGVKWEVQGKQITLTVQIPVNTTAEIRLDKAKAVLESDGLTFTREADYMAAEAGSGTYHIAFEQ